MSTTSTTPRFFAFQASVGACVALMRRSWVFTGFALASWAAVVLTSRATYGNPADPPSGDWPLAPVGFSLVISGSILLGLRSHLLNESLYLPASKLTRSLAIAVVGTLVSLAGYLGVAAIGSMFQGVSFTPIPVLLTILAVGVVSSLMELGAKLEPRVNNALSLATFAAMAGIGLWRGAGWWDVEILPWLAAGVILVASQVSFANAPIPVPVFLQFGIRDTAFPPGAADPILAVRALLGAERWRSVGWRLVPAAVFVLMVWLTGALDPAEGPGWGQVGSFAMPIFAIAPFILPISAFGVQAAGVALTLPVSPLRVQHAVVREAAIRAGLVFGILLAHELVSLGINARVVTPTGDFDLYGRLAFSCWVVVAFALCVGASAWVTYPSQLWVLLVKVGMISLAVPLGVGWFLSRLPAVTPQHLQDRYLGLCAVLTLVGLLALALGELRARRAFRAYRSAS